MTKLLNDFEGGTTGTAVTTANSGGGTRTAFTAVSTGVRYTSTQALHGALSATTAGDYTVQNNVRWALANETTVNISGYFRTTAATSADLFLLRLSTTGDVTGVTVKINVANALRVTGSDSSTLWTATNAFPVNTWVRVELWANTSTNQFRAAYFTGDSAIATEDSGILTGPVGGGSLYVNARHGLISSPGATYTGSVYWDNIQAWTGSDATSSLIGPYNTVLRQNTADGGTNGTAVSTGNSGGGSGTAWDLVSIPTGTLTYSSTQARQGTLSYKFVTTTATTAESVLRWGDTLNQAAASLRCYVFLPATSPTVATGLAQFSCGTTGSITGGAKLALTTAGRLTVQDSTGLSLWNSASAVPTGTWVRLELYTQPGSSTTGVIGGGYATGTGALTEQFTSSTANAGTGPVARAQFGKNSGTWSTQTFYMDDLAVGDQAAFLGTGNLVVSTPPPTCSATASPTSSVEPGVTVTLTGSDASGTSGAAVVTRAWTQTGGASAGTITGASTQTATVTAPGTIAGDTLSFTYTVTDSNGASASATATTAVLASTERAVIGGVEVPLRIVDAATTPTTPPVAPTRPTGAGYVRYEDLQTGGLTLRQVLAKATGGQVVTFPVGTFEFADFNDQGSTAGLLLPSGCGGLWGSGSGADGSPATIFQMTANTSTKASSVPAQSTGNTNNLRLIETTNDNTVFKSFQLKGTAQGHFYNGLAIFGSSGHPLANAVVDGVFFNGCNPGNSSSPPGETFALDTNHTDNCQILNCLFDGRDVGAGYGSSLIGHNSSTNTYVADTTCQYAWYGCGITYWLCSGIHTARLVSKYNGWGGTGGHGINHENVGGTVLHDSPTLYIDLTHGHGKHISLQQSSTYGYIDNPNVSLTNITHDAGATGGCFSVLIGDKYQGSTQVQTSLPRVTKAGVTLTGRDASVSTSNPDPATQFFRYH